MKSLKLSLNVTRCLRAQAKCRSEDIKLQAIQQSLIKSHVCVLRVAEALSNSAKANEKPDYKSVLSTLRDSMALAGHSNQDLNQFRRELFKPSISGSMQRIVKDVPEEEENLFGDNLEKRAKELDTPPEERESTGIPQSQTTLFGWEISLF